jgi:amino acid adenylation domain-containing protein
VRADDHQSKIGKVALSFMDVPLISPLISPIHQLFEAQAQRTASAVALVSCATRLAYGELNERANQLAHLLRLNDLQRCDLVGIALPRSAELVVALLAVLKSGAAYVPLDPAYPGDRLNFMVADSGCRFVITTSAVSSSILLNACEVICIDRCTDQLGLQPITNPGVDVSQDDLAYVIYTSGSSGQPKGVAIEHRSVAAFLAWAVDCFSSVELSGFLAATSICFDLSVFEIFAPLCCGGRVLLADSILELPELPYRNEVRLVNTVPSAMRQLLSMRGCPSSVCTVCLAGEVFPLALVRQLRDLRKPLRVLNLYGPTEDTIYSTYAEVDLECDSAPPIGRPLAGTRAYVVNEAMQLCPHGVSGELLLGGAGLARGYLRRRELTAERFLPDPFVCSGGDRVYRTGDRVILQADGQLSYLGRLDDQVKIRGYRIELAEVEQALAGLDGVTDCIVNAVDEPSGNQGLAAYFCGGGSADRLRAQLAQVLPVHMIPSIFMPVDQIPRTPNGKRDRAGLPPPEWGSAERMLWPDRSEQQQQTEASAAHSAVLSGMLTISAIEARLLNLCQEIIFCPHLRVDDSLLNAGFHSLAFTQLSWRIRQAFGVSLSYRQVFTRHTVAELAALVQAKHVEASEPYQPDPTSSGTKVSNPPLSFSQERVWFLEKLYPGNLAYHFQSLLYFRGLLDIQALERALNLLLARHEILRTSFPEEEGCPYQRIHPFARFTLPVKDVCAEDAERQIATIIRTPFDLEHVPPVRWVLFRLRPDEHWLLHAEHHLLHDGWEYEVFLRELFICYDAFLNGRRPDLPPLAIQFADFAIWQRQESAAGRWDRELEYWVHRLADAPSPAQLPTDRSRPTAGFAGAQLRHPFTHQFYARLQAAAAREGVTPFMWLHAAFQTFLYRYTGQEEIIVGSGVANRQSANAQQLLGMVINTVPLRVDFRGQPSFRELLSRVRLAILEALDNQNAPFDLVIRRVAPGTELFNTFFDTYDREYPSYQSDVLKVERRDALNNGSCKFELVALVLPAQSTPAILLWEYNGDLFTQETASRMMHHFLALLTASIENPELSVADLPILSLEERQRILAMGKGREPVIKEDSRIDRIFTAVAEAQAHADAVIYKDERISYRELDERAGEMARKLNAHDLQPGSVVAFRLPRGPQAICAMLAILRSDCAFLPLDPKLPKLRHEQLLQLAGVSLLITTDGIIRLSSTPCGPRWGPERAAYVLFTSGSTGVPKAVCVPHQAVVRLVRNVDYVRLDADTRFLQLAPLSFDACMLEIWGPLLNGGVVVFHPQDLPDCAELGRTIEKHAATTAWLTASLFNQVIDAAPEVLRPLRELLTGGEALSVRHVVRALTALRETKLTNGYGPTEATTFTTTFEIPRDFDPRAPRVPIGRPLPDTHVYVLDEQRQLSPIGVPGEIYIGGAGLALGYLGDEALTAERFVTDHINGQRSARLYRTGDCGRMLPDGNLDCIGRFDRQVKIRGHRIEFGEIENALLRCRGVSAAVAVVTEKPTGDKRLLAYVVPDEMVKPTVVELQTHLQQNLPDYMVPNNFVLLDALPLTSSGKLDSKALIGFEAVECIQNPQPISSAATPLEEVLVGIWANVLGLDRVGVHENFFALGGHSLLAIRLIHEINSAFAIDLPVRALFSSPTVAGQAREIERLRAAAKQEQRPHHPLLVPLRPSGRKLPFFLVAGGFGGEDELIVYAGLTRYLDSQRPFYGLRIRGVDDLVEPHETIEAMAAEHVTEIRRVQPRGPYLVGGSCLGGVVALEIARQIVAQGEKVESLILIDSNYLTWSSFLRYRIRRFWYSEILPLMQAWQQNRAQFLSVLNQHFISRVSPSSEQKQGREKVRIGLTYLQTVRRYTPRPYHGPITLIMCEEGTRDPSRVWRDVARAGLDVQYVPGNHFTHLRKYAAITAARLNACLESAHGEPCCSRTD